MKTSPAIAALLVLAFATPLPPLTAQERALAPVFPPLIETADGVLPSGGLAVEMVREAGRRAGVDFAIEIQPWARAYSTALAAKNVFLFPMARTAEREALFEWLGPVNRLDYHVFRLRAGVAPSIASLEQAKNRTIGVLRNDVIHSYLTARGGMTVVQGASNLESLVALLLGGRVDYIVTTGHTVRAELAKLGHPYEEVETLFLVDGFSSDRYSYLAVAKGSSQPLIDALRHAFESMRGDGTWDTIFKKYQ